VVPAEPEYPRCEWTKTLGIGDSFRITLSVVLPTMILALQEWHCAIRFSCEQAMPMRTNIEITSDLALSSPQNKWVPKKLKRFERSFFVHIVCLGNAMPGILKKRCVLPTEMIT
jgi:hypothetical protein